MLLPLAHRSRIYTYLNELLSISQEIPHKIHPYTAHSMHSQTLHYTGEGCLSLFAVLWIRNGKHTIHAHLQCVIPASPDVQLILQKRALSPIYYVLCANIKILQVLNL